MNHVNNLGWTALLEANILNNGNPAQQQTGADVNIPDRRGVSPLTQARNKGFKEIEAILVQAVAKA